MEWRRRVVVSGQAPGGASRWHGADGAWHSTIARLAARRRQPRASGYLRRDGAARTMGASRAPHRASCAALPPSCSPQPRWLPVTSPPVLAVPGGPARGTVWRVIHRRLGAEPPAPSDNSQAPCSPPRRTLPGLRGVRWAVAPCGEASNAAWGMAHDAVRQEPGGHPPC